MPSFEGATEWLVARPDEASLVGVPVLVQFWALSCHLCKEHLPKLVSMARELGPRGLRIVSVHMPRNEGDLDTEAVRRFAADHGLDFPIAIDDTHAIGHRFETAGLWPYYFVFDRAGRLRARSAGANAMDVVAAVVERLLAEAA